MGNACQTHYQLILSNVAEKALRRLDKPLWEKIQHALLALSQSPRQLGEALTSPLLGLYSHHMVYRGREFRIAYEIDEHGGSVRVCLMGFHENFYRRLRR